MMTDPIKHIAHPIRPKGPNSSFRNIAARTALPLISINIQKYPLKTLNAPNGVTRIAGAKVYAAKFAISPRTTTINITPNKDEGKGIRT